MSAHGWEKRCLHNKYNGQFFTYNLQPSLLGHLLRFLFPAPPASLTEVSCLQDDTFERRRRGPIAVCRGTYGPISLWYSARTVLMTVACLLVILLAFVFYPVHDVIKEPSYWWECAIQCSLFWTGG